MKVPSETRQPGHYWVRLNQSQQWTVARWTEAREWMVIGSPIFLYDRNMEEIDERRIERLPEMPVIRETQG